MDTDKYEQPETTVDYRLLSLPPWGPFRLARAQVTYELSRQVAAKLRLIAFTEVFVALVPDVQDITHALGTAMADCIEFDARIDELLALLLVLEDGPIRSAPDRVGC